MSSCFSDGTILSRYKHATYIQCMLISLKGVIIIYAPSLLYSILGMASFKRIAVVYM